MNPSGIRGFEHLDPKCHTEFPLENCAWQQINLQLVATITIFIRETPEVKNPPPQIRDDRWESMPGWPVRPKPSTEAAKPNDKGPVMGAKVATPMTQHF